jgi:transposase
MKDTLYIGMDLHKKTSTFCVLNNSADVVTLKTIPTIPDEIKKFIESLGKKKEIKLVMEPLSQWYFYADFLESLGVKVTLAHPLKMKIISQSKVKTDEKDAQILATFLRNGMIPEAYFAPKQVRDWKELCRARSSIVDLKIQVKNKIHAILFRNALIYPRSTLFTKKGIEWVKTLELNSFFKANLNSNLSILENLNLEIEILEKLIEQTVEETSEMKLLCTIPGINKITAIIIMAEIGEITRFPNPKKLQSYAGLVPTIRNSGGRVNHGHISKQGSVYLRHIMVQAAQHQPRLKKHVGLKWFYERMLLNKKNSKTAVVATARKLLTVVYKVLSEKRAFEERLPKTYKII